MKNFIEKNWVFISGLISAIVVVLQQYTGGGEADLKVVGFAVLMAVLSYFGNQWKGQGLSVLGIIGTLAWTFQTELADGHISGTQLILQTLVAIGLLVAPKPQTIEKKPE